MIERLKQRWATSRWGGQAGTDAWLLVYLGALVGLYVKHQFLLGQLAMSGRSPVAEHPLFPSFFLNPKVALIAYCLPILSLFCLWKPSVLGRQLAGLAVIFGSGILLLHIDTYNDATFTTGLWVGIWLWWWGGRAGTAERPSRDQAILFGKAIVGLFFLGGAVGKLTSEYWDGSALYQLYFVQKGHFPFSYLRESLSEDSLRLCALYFSRATVIIELLLGTLLFWPLRWATASIVIMITCMVVISRIQLFSVVGPLMILMLALMRLDRRGEPLEAVKAG